VTRFFVVIAAWSFALFGFCCPRGSGHTLMFSGLTDVELVGCGYTGTSVEGHYDPIVTLPDHFRRAGMICYEILADELNRLEAMSGGFAIPAERDHSPA
jgi:hypothetical protein